MLYFLVFIFVFIRKDVTADEANEYQELQNPLPIAGLWHRRRRFQRRC